MAIRHLIHLFKDRWSGYRTDQPNGKSCVELITVRQSEFASLYLEIICLKNFLITSRSTFSSLSSSYSTALVRPDTSGELKMCRRNAIVRGQVTC